MEIRPPPNKRALAGAALVHAFTATGAVLGFMALLAASNGAWEAAFGWLGAAFIVDGVDGPMARYVDVKRVLPRFSGEDLDKIIDYLTYVTVPAYMVARGPAVPEALRLPLAAAMMMTSLYHFSDKHSKTPDGYFVGFPGNWNIVVFYCFALAIPPGLAAILIAACAILTFVPFRYVHPLRVRRLMPLTVGVSGVWGIAAVAAVMQGFPASGAIQAVFALSAIYIAGLGLSARAGNAGAEN
jgi:phosphatidylcholine synthase